MYKSTHLIYTTCPQTHIHQNTRRKGKVKGQGFLHFLYHNCWPSLGFLATGGVSCAASLLLSGHIPSLTMSLVVGVANGVASGNEGVTEEEEEGGRGEVFKVDVGEGGRWLAGAVVPIYKI